MTSDGRRRHADVLIHFRRDRYSTKSERGRDRDPRDGRADDRFRLSDPKIIFNNNELYSGSDDDLSPERIRSGQSTIRRWSLMRRGWGDEMLIRDGRTSYYVFSIEEVSTLR